MPQLQELYESILEVKFDRRNFSNKMLHHNQWGATYSVNGVNLGVPTLWICNVTHDVFGEHPKDIFIQAIR